MKKTKLVLILMMFVLSVVLAHAESPTRKPASAPPTKTEMIQYLKELMQDQEFLGKENPYQKGSKKHAIFAAYMKNLMTNDLLLQKLVDTIYEYKDKIISIESLFGWFEKHEMIKKDIEEFNNIILMKE